MQFASTSALELSGRPESSRLCLSLKKLDLDCAEEHRRPIQVIFVGSKAMTDGSETVMGAWAVRLVFF